MTATRYAAGTNTTLLSAGVPLAPGQVFPEALDTVRVYRNGVEQSVFVEEIPRRHLDGSVRSVLIQCDAGSMANGVEETTWELRVNQGVRGTADRSKDTAALAFTEVPDGFLFYTNAQDRVDSYMLMGPTKTITNSPQREPFLKYHTTVAAPASPANGDYFGLKAGLDLQWSADAATGAPVVGSFFNGDAGWANLSYWVRGGSNTYLERFLRYARVYAANADTSGGLEWTKWYRTPRSHYWLTGDTRSVTFMTTAGQSMWNYHNNDGMFTAVDYVIDPRAYSQNAGLNLSAWLCGAADTNRARARTIYDTLVRLQGITTGGVAASSGVHYYPDGAGTCRGQKDYMQGLMHTFMIEYVENAEPSLRATYLPWMKQNLDRLWEQQDPSTSFVNASPDNSFTYFWSPEMHTAYLTQTDKCSNLDTVYATNSSGGNPGRRTARHGYLVEPFAYYAFHAGDSVYMTRAERAFSNAMTRMVGWTGFEGKQAAYNMWSVFGYGVG